MPVGTALVNEVAAVLTKEPKISSRIRGQLPGTYSSRAIRYALQTLVKQGRAERKAFRHPEGLGRIYGYSAIEPTEGV